MRCDRASYLYAIAGGCERIYDFDDDNHLRSSQRASFSRSHSHTSPIAHDRVVHPRVSLKNMSANVLVLLRIVILVGVISRLS